MWKSGELVVGRVVVLAEGQVFVRIELDEVMGPEGEACAWGGSGRGCGVDMRVVGEG